MKNLIVTLLLASAVFTGCSLKIPSGGEHAQLRTIEGGTYHDDENYLENYFDQNERDGKTSKDKKFGDYFNKYLNTRAGGDCSGFVSIVNQKHANMYFDESAINKYYDKGGRKSKAIFNLYASKNLIADKNPKIGDLIFFANTLGRGAQKNKDMKNVTHVGIITDVAKDGTVRFIHNYGGKIKHSYMNLTRKNVFMDGKKEINSYMVRCKGAQSSCLASNRFAGYGIVK